MSACILFSLHARLLSAVVNSCLRVDLYTVGFVNGMTHKKLVYTQTPQNMEMQLKDVMGDASLVKSRCQASNFLSHFIDAKGQAY
jgi:hypothetical protein